MQTCTGTRLTCMRDINGRQNAHNVQKIYTVTLDLGSASPFSIPRPWIYISTLSMKISQNFLSIWRVLEE